MLRGSELTARVKSGEEGIHWEMSNVGRHSNVDFCEGQRAGLTCDVDVGRGGVQRCRCPCSTAVARSDAFYRGENVRY